MAQNKDLNKNTTTLKSGIIYKKKYKYILYINKNVGRNGKLQVLWPQIIDM